MKTHKWRDLIAQMLPEVVAKAERKAQLLLAAMDLQDILHDRGMKQEELAKQMEIGRRNGSPMRQLAKLNVNALQDAVDAMGGELEIIAHFPDKDYLIDQFTTNGEQS